MGKRKKTMDEEEEMQVETTTESAAPAVPQSYFDTGELCTSVLESSHLPDYFSAQKGANLRSFDTFETVLSADTAISTAPHPELWQEQKTTRYKPAFATWSLLLEQGINLLLYGVGSKITLVSRFVNYVRKRRNFGVVRAQGYIATCSLREILKSLLTAFDISKEAAPAHKDPQYMMEYFLIELEQKALWSEVEPVLLVVENLDGSALLKQETQVMLSKLAAHPLIYFLATIENPHLSLLWNLSVLESFNFLYAEVPTYYPYHEELSHTKDPLELFPKGSKRNEIHGIQLILNSMTHAHKAILQLLAHTQQAQSTTAGIPLKQFFTLCKNQTLVSSEKQLKEYLIEAKDHELIEQRKDRKGQVTVAFKLADEVVKLIATGKIYR